MNLKIKVSNSDNLSGIRCLRATEDILKGEIIEECPVVIIPNEEIDDLAKTVLTNYEFNWDDSGEAVVFGYGSLFNHSYTPNVSYEPDFQKKIMIFKATKNIKKDEELFIDYTNGDNGDSLDPGYLNFKN